jgi:hypothetical protein
MKSIKYILLRAIISFFKNNPSLRSRILWLLKDAQKSPNDLIILDYPVHPIPRYGYSKPPHTLLNDLIGVNNAGYADLLHKFLSYSGQLQAIQKTSDGRSEPSWDNAFLTSLDAVSLYSMLALHNPEKYVEIGSGNSTKFARRAIKDLKLRTRLISFDPCPRKEIDSLCDQLIRHPLEDAPLDIFKELNNGDILFVDNSHRVFTNSDSTVVFLDILPYLKSGVIVHFHDIYLPDDYPIEWKEWYFSEQYVLAAAILAQGTKYEILLPNHYMDINNDLQKILNPLWEHSNMHGVKKAGSSFWMRIK